VRRPRSTRLSRYLDHDLWTVDAARLGPARRLGSQLLRLLIVAVRAARDGLLNVRAMGLVYSTLLSLVPLLAVTFSVLKAFGAQYQIRPLLEHGLGPLGPQRDEIAGRIVDFVSNTQVGVLGALGVAGLLYTVLSLMDRVEDALNHIWHARRPRGLARKFTDYLSMLLAGPVLVLAAFALIASAQSHWVVRWVLATIHLERLVLFVTGYLMPLMLLGTAFALLYRLVPNTEVSVRSAIVGGAVAAVLWHLAGLAFTAFLSGSTRYAAIYSGFAGLMVFMIWLYVAWLIVLIGAQVGYFHQYPRSYVEARARHGALYREWIALAIVGDLTRRFLDREPPARLADITRSTGAPLAEMQPIVDDLVARGILLRAAEPPGLALAADPDALSVMDVLEVVRDPGATDRAALVAAADPGARMLQRRDAAVREAFEHLSLRELCRGGGPGRAVWAARTPAAREASSG
jgi:membrane protein